MSKPAPLYGKQQVIACLGINPSQFDDFCNRGIIPAPCGREGNAYRWNSTLIQAIAVSLLAHGDDYAKEHTIDILLKDVLAFENF
jgi:hypothetical protein